MPIYLFRCRYAHCDYLMEVYFDMVPGPPAEVSICPIHKETLRRAYTTPTLTFKGTGWAGKPAIFDDPVAKDHPGQQTNWGKADAHDFPLDSEIKDDKNSKPFDGYTVVEEPKGDVLDG